MLQNSFHIQYIHVCVIKIITRIMSRLTRTVIKTNLGSMHVSFDDNRKGPTINDGESRPVNERMSERV